MKKVIVMLLLAVIIVSSGCVNQEEAKSGIKSDITEPTTAKGASYSKSIEKVEVLHFHGNRQCQGCINVGKCAEDAVNQYFQKEQESGLVIFKHINGELSENLDIVQQYGAIGSSLWIGVYKNDDIVSKEQNINVWYKTSDMEKCRECIKDVIEEKLKG